MAFLERLSRNSEYGTTTRHHTSFPECNGARLLCLGRWSLWEGWLARLGRIWGADGRERQKPRKVIGVKMTTKLVGHDMLARSYTIYWLFHSEKLDQKQHLLDIIWLWAGTSMRAIYSWTRKADGGVGSNWLSYEDSEIIHRPPWGERRWADNNFSLHDSTMGQCQWMDQEYTKRRDDQSGDEGKTRLNLLAKNVALEKASWWVSNEIEELRDLLKDQYDLRYALDVTEKRHWEVWCAMVHLHEKSVAARKTLLARSDGEQIAQITVRHQKAWEEIE